MTRQKGLGGQPDHRVLILGGGFGGVYTALGLERQLRPEDRTEVTLINNENFFLFTPLLCEIVSSQIDTSHAINPIRRMFKRTRFVEGEAVSVDPARRCVAVRHPNGDTYDYPYDHLVVALGARTGFFGMRDVQEHALTAKTLGDAIHLRNWAIQMLETADTERDPALRAKLLTFVVAGGGFTGVEVAGELNDLLRQILPSYPSIAQRDVRVILVEAKGRVLPEFDEKLALFTTNRLKALGVELMLDTMVDGASAEEVRLKGKEPIATRTLIWTTGVAPNPFVASNPITKDGKGWVSVDDHMRVIDMPGVWATGDCARIPNPLQPGHNYPSLAQHAIREGHQLARNIAATIRGEPSRPFRYRSLGQMATLGHFNGVGTLDVLPKVSIPVSGFIAWAIWRTYYLYRLPRIEKQLRVATDWAVDLLFGRDISQIQTYQGNRAGERQESEMAGAQPGSSKSPAANQAGGS